MAFIFFHCQKDNKTLFSKLIYIYIFLRIRKLKSTTGLNVPQYMERIVLVIPRWQMTWSLTSSFPSLLYIIIVQKPSSQFFKCIESVHCFYENLLQETDNLTTYVTL